MHHLPRFFGHSRRRKDMDSKQRARGPKLERRLAKKNIDYEPSTSSPSSRVSEETTAALRTRSLDLSPVEDRSSFRVQGIDGEFDLICKSLGLSVDDFAIPIDAWEARKARSSSDLLPRSRLRYLESSIAAGTPTQTENGGANELSSSSDLLPRSRLRYLESSIAAGTTTQMENGGANELSDEFADRVRLSDVDRGQREFVELNGCSDLNEDQNDLPESVGRPISFQPYRCGGGGIKGARPPLLAPPPSISLPAIDNTSSTWDIMKSFAPDGGGGTSCLREVIYSDEEDEEIGKVEEANGARRGETAVLSESCSFTTTSNDDDSSSTTTEPTSNISPNGRFRRIVTSWEKGDLLGRGSFGSVYEGIADGGFFFAVKEVSLLDQGEQGRQSVYQLEQEIALLSQFEHENIVQYYGTDKDESKLYIFLELVNKGSLLNLYQKYTLRDSQVSSYTRQILHGLKYLHNKNVVHRDIKCANLLVDANGSVKLADFGLAKATKLNDVKSCKGTAFWMAPEVVRSQGYGLAADIWSLGCTVLEMLTRQIPYSHLECMQALYRIGKGEPPLVPDSLSRDARDFILKCVQVNPTARPTASMLLDHPFVQRPLPTGSGSESPYHSAQRVQGLHQ